RPGDLTLASAAISPDGKRLVTGRWVFGGPPQPVEVWDVKPNAALTDSRPRQIGLQPGDAMHTLFSADGRHAFVVSRAQGPLRGPAGAGPAAPQTPGASADKSHLVVYDVVAGRPVSDFDVPALQAPLGNGGSVPARLALSPDGKSLYLGDDQGNIRVYDW